MLLMFTSEMRLKRHTSILQRFIKLYCTLANEYDNDDYEITQNKQHSRS